MEDIRKSQGSLTWFVTYYNINSNKIGHYDVLKHREGLIKRLKKQCATKTDFSEAMRREMMYHFWSKCEWELIIEVDDDDRVWLNPWIGCKDLQSVRVDVTDCKDFDWKLFAAAHIGKQVYKNKAKIDVFDQIDWRWQEFIDYCWQTRLKYERDNPKFHSQ